MHSTALADKQWRSWFRRQLLSWFRASARDLPWRQSRDPYAVWVSEIMLQQTQVATVIPYFQSFLAKFPTIADLAQAPEEEVLRAWEGLGYYRRARHLHAAAKILADLHAGAVPDDPHVLRALPGFGRYTVGAVLSQAFDRRLPILEANSMRVLCRFFAYQGNPRSGPVQKQLWETAELLLPRRGCGEFNQALMELGALVCTPRSPRCDSCPLKKRCTAHQTGQQAELPTRAPRPEPIMQQEIAVVVQRDNAVLLVQRPEEGRWAGLWEFPHAPCAAETAHEDAAAEMVLRLTGIKAKIGQELATIAHSVTRYQITLRCLLADYHAGDFRSEFYIKGEWTPFARLPKYPLSSPQRKLARLLAAD